MHHSKERLMRKLNRGLAVLLTAGCLWPQAGRSEADSPVRLETMVVTATKTEKKVEDAPGSVSVVSAEELKKQNIRTVDDAIRTLSGVFVKRSKGLMDSTASVRMRGFSGDEYTLVLLDGQPLNDAYTAGVEWASLPVENIDRIEVIRGTGSALYGGNAMGGVINIITKSPEKLELSGSAGVGSHDSYRFRLSAGDRLWDRLSLRLGYETQGTDGYPTTPVVRTITPGEGNVAGGYLMNDKTGKPTRWVVGDQGDNGAERQNVNTRLGYDFSDTGNITFSGNWGRYEYDYDRPHTYMGTYGDARTYAMAGEGQRARFQPNDFINYTGIGENKTDTYSLSAEELFGEVHVSARLGTVQVDDQYTLETGSGAADYDTSPGSLKITENEMWFSELKGDIPLGDAHLLTAGLSYRADRSDTDDYTIPFYRSFRGRSDSTFYSGGKSRSWAVFAQDEWQAADPLTFYLGARFDWWEVYDGSSGEPGAEIDFDSNSESEVSPKIAAVWKALPQTAVRASVGHAFRAPTLYELYRTWVSGSTTYQSNPELSPETVWTYELGVEQFLFDQRTRLSLTGYRNDIDDLIYNRVEGNNRIRSNAGKARTYGIELEAAQKITEELSLWGNFTWTDARIKENETDPASEDKRVPGIPETAWNLGMDLEYPWFTASLVGRYFSKIYNDSDNGDEEDGVYGTYEPMLSVDAKVILTPLEWLDISLSIDNIFDEETYQYYQTDGRTFFAELTVRY